MNAYFARQPILDVNLNLHGYELLFRPNPQAEHSGSPMNKDGDSATLSILQALDWGGIQKITGGKYAFVNFTGQLLLEDVITQYPKEYLVVEILETVKINAQLIDVIRSLKKKGYRIALDDYVYNPSDQELLELCNIIKVELDGTLESFRNLKRVCEAVDKQKCRILAEKVENQRVFEIAKAMGCTLFQGYFFAKPKLVSERVVTPIKVNVLRLMQEFSKEDPDFEVLSGIIKNDLALSVKTLRLVNSAYYSLQYEVKSIVQAVVLLGVNELRKWLMYSALSSMVADKPTELVNMSMIRAYFCEYVSTAIGLQEDSDAYFLAGLFSLLDTMTDCSLEDCTARMQLPLQTRLALLEEENPGRTILKLIIAMENGDWDHVTDCCAKLKLNEFMVSTFYMEAIDQANRFYHASFL